MAIRNTKPIFFSRLEKREEEKEEEEEEGKEEEEEGRKEKRKIVFYDIRRGSRDG